MNFYNVGNKIDINSYFSFPFWFHVSSVSRFRLCSVAPENIAVRILSLNSFVLKTLKEVQLKCEMCDLYLYTEILINTNMWALINTEIFD